VTIFTFDLSKLNSVNIFDDDKEFIEFRELNICVCDKQISYSEDFRVLVYMSLCFIDICAFTLFTF
jgi:hypothetical protein